MTDLPHEMKEAITGDNKQPYCLQSATKCGAKNRQHQPCSSPAMTNGRCRMHGGKSTGAITPEGKEAVRTARLIHGYYSKPSKMDRLFISKLLKNNKEFL